MEPEALRSYRTRRELDEAIERIPKKKVFAYLRHRDVGPTSDHRFLYDYKLWKGTGTPYEVVPSPASSFRWNTDRYKGFEWFQDGFALRATVEYDDTDPDLSWLGKVYDKNDRERPDSAKPVAWDRDQQPRRWFEPGCNVEEERKAHRRLHTKHESWLRAKSSARWDYKRLADYGTGWHMVGVVVTAYKGETKLGSASCWGIESDSPDYHLDVAHELAEQAIEAAKDELARLAEEHGFRAGKILKTYRIEAFQKTVGAMHLDPDRMPIRDFTFYHYQQYLVTEESVTDDHADAVVLCLTGKGTVSEHLPWRLRFTREHWNEIVTHALREVST